MNWTKNLFIISLLNFSMIIGVVIFYPLLQGEEESDTLERSIPVTVPATITSVPTITLISSPTPTQAAAKQAAPAKAQTTPATKTNSAPSAAPVDPLAGKCIIYVSGIRYNITEFRNIHGGGDIFQCGSDMTDNFNSQHPGSYLDQMARYRI